MVINPKGNKVPEENQNKNHIISYTLRLLLCPISLKAAADLERWVRLNTHSPPLATRDSRENGPSRQKQWYVVSHGKDPGHLGSEDHKVTESEIAVTPGVCMLYKFGGCVSAFCL